MHSQAPMTSWTDRRDLSSFHRLRGIDGSKHHGDEGHTAVVFCWKKNTTFWGQLVQHFFWCQYKLKKKTGRETTSRRIFHEIFMLIFIYLDLELMENVMNLIIFHMFSMPRHVPQSNAWNRSTRAFSSLSGRMKPNPITTGLHHGGAPFVRPKMQILNGRLLWGVTLINYLREPQHTPGTYPRHPQSPKWKEFLHKLLVGGLGYVPVACWKILRN